MSSPLGGFYIEARNRNTKRQFEQGSRVQIKLVLKLETDKQTVFEQTQSVYCGETNTFENEAFSVLVKSEILGSGLLQVDCHISGEEGFIANQIVHIEHGESLTTLLAGKMDTKLTVKGHI